MYKEIQKGADAKSFMINGLRISSYIRKPLLIYDFATSSHLNFLIYEEN
jgi:hypothetical protein